MKNKRTLNNIQSEIKVSTSIIVSILILLLVFLINFNYQVFSYSPETVSAMGFKYSTLRGSKNMLCKNKSKHLSSYSWTLRREEGPTGITDTAEAYTFAYANTYGRGTGSDQYYGDYVQQAYWHLCNSSTGEANTLYKKAIAYENYRKNYQSLEITNVTKRNSDSISFKITGSHNDTYGFGRITSVTIYNSSNNKEIKKAESQYGTQTISGLKNYDSVYIKVTYETLTAEAKYSEYKTTRVSDGKTYPGQPIVIFEGKFENVSTSKTSNSIALSTDISLQKYITKVNENNLTSNETNLTSRENTKTSTNETNTNVRDSIRTNVNADNKWKRDNVVKIEKGDIVTYRISVYNNSNATASNIVVKDTLPYTINSNGTIKSWATLVSVYRGNTKIDAVEDKSNNNTYQWTIESLSAGSFVYFDVKLKFAENTSSVLINTAWISSTSPTNEKNYRTLDRDYVRMNQYKVSLKKYVSSTQLNGNTTYYANNITNDPYTNIRTYLTKNYNASVENTLNNLEQKYYSLKNNGFINYKDLINNSQISNSDMSNVKKINGIDTLLEDWDKIDVNNDTQITQKDIELIEIQKINSSGDITFTQDTLEKMVQYIASDINSDGIVNEQDKVLYQVIKSDLTGDGILDEKDIYLLVSLISDLNSDEKVDVTDLAIVKTKYLQETYQNDAKSIIEAYINSDIDNDGAVTKKGDFTSSDGVDENEIHITDEELQEIYDSGRYNIENPGGKLEDAQNLLNLYDINHDNSFDNNDCSSIDTYIKKYKDLLNKFKEYQETNENGENSYYIALEDYIEENSINENDNENVTIPYEEYYDFNGDKKVDRDDLYDFYEVMTYGEMISNLTTMDDTQYNDYMDNLDINKDERINIIDFSLLRIATGEKSYNAEIEQDNALDINGDGLVNSYDLTVYNQYQNIQINKIDTVFLKDLDFIQYLQSTIKLGTIVVSNLSTNDYDFDGDGYIGKNDIETLRANINKFKENEDLTNFLVKNQGINIAFDENQMNVSIESLDVYAVGDEAGKINKADYSYLADLLSSYDMTNISTYTGNLSIETIQTFLLLADLNENSAVEEMEVNMIKSSYNVDFDLNGDGYINADDVTLYEELANFINNGANKDDLANSIKRNISPEANNNVYSKTTNYYNSGTQNIVKYNNPVEVEYGMTVTYTIELKNNSTETEVKISKVTDILPNNIELIGITNSNNGNIPYSQSSNTVAIEPNITLGKKESAVLFVTVIVKEPNLSLDCLRNVAEITEIKNPQKNVVVTDTTPYDNLDVDYIKLKDITIEGMVWNDKALDKTESNYNGLYDSEENKLSGIKVYLYRVSNSNTQLVSSKYTNNNGEYQFSKDDIGTEYDKSGNSIGTYSVVDKEKFIKGPQVSSSITRWKGSYYSYYIVFEYDGITYTSTPDGNVYVKIEDEEAYKNNTYKINSNAREKLNVNSEFDGYVENNKTRQTFNSKFGKLTEGVAQYDNEDDTKSMDIYYNTKNETGYIPQSNHKLYDSNGNLLEGYKIQSSTNLIQLSNKADLEEQLKYVNLGLRGRDIFDLELTSDVSKVEVTVNNKQGVYNYTNKVTIRDADVRKQNIENGEDMANISRETSNNYVEDRNGEEGQQLNNTDLNISSDYTHTNRNKYDDTQGLQDIKVTYKITVTNASQTNGIATVITDYYDKCYTNPENAYIEIKMQNGEIRTSSEVEIKKNDTSNSKYNKVNLHVKDAIGEILGEDGMLTQSQSYNLYFTLTMTNQGMDNLKTLFQDNKTLKYPTYNMAEIRKYKTACGENQTDYTRGLIDKDSAPGSVEIEKVRLTTTESSNVQETNGSPSTVEYYFSKRTNDKVDLSKLKYEDDTYATPTLYFTSNTRERKIEGTVFEDYTEIINNNNENELVRTKTGNGIQDGDEPGIKGAIVQLVELSTDKNADEILEDEGIVRYETTTDEKGNYRFSGFLPGNYIIRYKYGNTEETFTYDNNPNTKSYNGEDFQSTNNIGAYGSKTLKGYNAETLKFENTTDWYAYNEKEGVSTATDNSQRRREVSTSVTDFSDEEMTVLNNVRDGKNMDAAKVTYKENDIEKEITADIIRDATKMFATTPAMELTMEETVRSGDETKQNNSFTDYIVSNMNFGIAEVPVTTIDLQKHVYSLKISDSTGDNIIAEAQIDTSKAQVTVNPSKISPNRIDVVVNVLAKDLNMTKDDINEKIKYNKEDVSQNPDDNIVIKKEATAEQIGKLQYDMTMYSLAREITITKTWKVKSGNVLAAPGTSVLDISIEDDKLQGAKLEVTYEITASIYAEKNFNNDAVTIPSIKGIVDYIDNDLSYNKDLRANESNDNDHYWTVTTYNEVQNKFKEDEKLTLNNSAESSFIYGDGGFGFEEEEGLDGGSSDTETESIIRKRDGILDPEGIKYTTVVTAKNAEGGLLLTECGTGTAYITLERILSSTDSSIENIIQSSIDSYEYENNIEVTGIDYTNTVSGATGGFIYRDRVRTADRYIILAGRQHDTATSETIAIHPPTGENNNMYYYITTLISLGILTTGIILIKKYAIKEDNK